MERVITKNKPAFSSNTFLSQQDMVGVILGIFGFFLGRISFLLFLSPVAIAFLSLFFGTSHQFYIIIVLTGVGMATKLSGIYLAKYLICMIVMGVINRLVVKRLIRPTIYAKSAAGGVFTLCAGLGAAAYNDMSGYFALMAIFESMLVASLIIVLKGACGVITCTRRKLTLANEEMISLAVLLGGIIAGASDLTIGETSLSMFFSVAAILIISHKGGSTCGATAGMLLSFVQYMLGYSIMEQVVILGISGICAGFFKEKGKLATIVGFLSGFGVLSILMRQEIFNFQILSSIGLGTVLFILMPENFYFNFNAMLSPALDSTEDYLERVKDIISRRMYGLSHSFEKLSKSFKSLSEKKMGLNQKDVHRLIDDVASKACDKCGMKDFCWQSSFYDTYQVVLMLLGECEKKGRIHMSDVPEGFKKNCVNIQKFVETTVKLFEIYKLNLEWQNRIVESRELVSEQLSGVSKIIHSISSELDFYMDFKMDLEESILTELFKNRIEVDNVIVLENKLGKYEVSITQKMCFDRKNCGGNVKNIISRVLGRKMTTADSICNYSRDRCRIKLVEEQKFRVSSGAAKKEKAGSTKSGDSYSFMELKNGQCILALSDGMGSGSKAMEESNTAIELLEEFIESGFDKEIAIKIINSVLVLRNSEESFATLDICSIDLYQATAEFAKIGAAATYLLRDNNVQVIKSSSLPMGILPSVDIEVCSKKLRDDDIIVMVTDGLAEAIDDDMPKGQWIIDVLKSFSGKNPQDIADYLLREAESYARGELKDDMTVLAARIWERA